MKKNEKVSSTIKTSTAKALVKYCAKNNKTKSSIINQALEEFFKIEGTKDNIDFITEQIDKTIETRLKDFEDRNCRIMAKLTKSSLAGLYVNISVLEMLCDTKESKQLIKEYYEEANKKAYQVLKDGYLERDILSLFPKIKEK